MVIIFYVDIIDLGYGVYLERVMKSEEELCIILVKLNFEGWVECVKYRKEEVIFSLCNVDINIGWKLGWGVFVGRGKDVWEFMRVN